MLESAARPVTFLVERESHVKRRAVRMQCDEMLAGRPTKIFYQGNRYTREDVIVQVAAHPLFASAAVAAYENNPNPLKDLMRRVAQYAICEHLFEGEAESLGFVQ